MVEFIISVSIGYLALLLVLEAVIWKVQPDMDGVVTLHIPVGEAVMKRKLYGFRHERQLYVSSNHWFRQWYHAVLAHPEFDVECDGALGRYLAVPVVGSEHERVAQAYNQGFVLKLACGFAPQRFLRLDLVVGSPNHSLNQEGH